MAPETLAVLAVLAALDVREGCDHAYHPKALPPARPPTDTDWWRVARPMVPTLRNHRSGNREECWCTRSASAHRPPLHSTR